MKRNISLVLALSIIISVFSPVYGENLEKDLYETAGAILKDQEILLGTASGDLKLDQGFKREEMVVLLSRLHGEYDLAGKTSPKTKFVDIKNPFYKPYISWSVNKGLIKGSTDTIFGYSRILTVQEYQTALLRALGYTEESEDWYSVPDKAKEIGLMNNLDKDPKTKTTRGLMAAMTLNALRTNMKDKNVSLAEQLNLKIPDTFKVEAKANVVKDNVKIIGATKNTGKIKVVLKSKENQKTLEKETVIDVDGNFEVEFKGVPSGNYSYYFQNKNQTSKTSDLKVNELPFELLSVVADNLKEIKLNFNKPVDRSFALQKNNFTTSAGPILSSRLENDNKTVVLTLDKNVEMQNTRNYTVASPSIRSANGESLNLKENFSASDNAHPRVIKAEAIGNQRVKITLSEPIKYPSPSDFRIDDKRFYGVLDYNNENIIILDLKGNPLSDGKHSISILSLYDYAGFKSTEDQLSFEVLDTKTSPVVIGGNASLDQAVLEFDRDVDGKNLNLRDIYFYKYSNKMYPSDIKVKNNLLYLDFSGVSQLSEETTTIYLSGIRDFFGNQAKEIQYAIKPIADTSTPKVVDANIVDNNKAIELIYSKNVNASNKENYTIKDNKGQIVPIRDIEGYGRNFKIILARPLAIGSSKLTIKDIQDTSDRHNIMKNFEREFIIADTEMPVVDSYSGYRREVILSFSKEMDMQTVTDPSNYLLKFNNRLIYMDKNTEFNPVGDNKSVIITLPRTIDGREVRIGEDGNLKEIQVSGLKSKTGNLIEPRTLNFDKAETGNARLENASLVDSKTIELTFSQPITKASSYAFSLDSGENYITDTSVDGSVKVILKLRYPVTTLGSELKIRDPQYIETIIGTNAVSTSRKVLDKVAPKVDSNRDVFYMERNTITIPFTEDLSSTAEALIALDIDLLNLTTNRKVDSNDLKTSVSGNKVRLTVSNNKNNDQYQLNFKENPRYIMDKSNNLMESDYTSYITR